MMEGGDVEEERNTDEGSEGGEKCGVARRMQWRGVKKDVK